MEAGSNSSTHTSTLPFSISASLRWDTPGATESRTDPLPATYRARDGQIMAGEPISRILHHELVPHCLELSKKELKYAGSLLPPRPLHYQLVLGREIVISEKIELHLIWQSTSRSSHRVFLKPLPKYLLDAEFWSAHILPDRETNSMGQPQLAAAARGFLFSYTALIAYESDFKIAKDRGLLPAELTWGEWQIISAEYLKNHGYSSVSLRYWYGELRLGPFDDLVSIKSGFSVRDYPTYDSFSEYYGTWLANNLTLLMATLGYVVIALTAMQVGLATGRLGTNAAFQEASYGLTVFTLIGPLIAGAISIVYLVVVSAVQSASEIPYHKRRLMDMGVELEDRGNS